LDGIRYPDVERYYISMKSDDEAFKRVIIAAETPGRAKRLGDDKHKKSLFLQGVSKRPDWD
jgi:predicted NAD-dependent protein-ADP-ribosyltransferase YbiA (DUF1768 family)